MALVRAYKSLLGVDELYVADLDAIAGGAEQNTIVRSIAEEARLLWLDAGVSTVAQAERAIARGASRVVVGLETLPSFDALEQIVAVLAPERVAFSLDLRDGRPMTGDGAIRDLSPAAIAARAADAGAGSVIVLDVARVGSGRGVDLAIIAAVREAVSPLPLVAGGGVRGEDDMRSLAAAGCDAVLVATALHGAGGADLVRCARTMAVMRR